MKLAQNPHKLREEREKVLELAIGREVRSHRRQKINDSGRSGRSDRSLDWDALKN